MNASVSLGINGDLGSALMMSHGITFLALREVQDEFFPFALAALVVVHPIRAGDGEDDYVAVVLDATLCHMEMCAGAQERCLQFLEGFAEDCEEVLVAFSSMEASMEQVNKERTEAAAKPTKKTRGKKSEMGATKLATRQLPQGSPPVPSARARAPAVSGRHRGRRRETKS